MKKHLFLVAALMVAFIMPAVAQISTGQPHSTVIPRTGNRPQAGDWGLYLGGTVSQVMDLVDAINDTTATYWALPALNFKYYITDQWELRLGFEFDAQTKSKKFTYDGGDVYKEKNGHNYTRFFPGVAYHFSNDNILDVYLGAQLPIGWDCKIDKTTDGDRELKRRTGHFVIGAGLFMGVQVFIADLPFAIGIEGGFSGMLRAGGVPKTTYKDGGDKQVFYNDDPNIIKASAVEANWGADGALTFSYYFH